MIRITRKRRLILHPLAGLDNPKLKQILFSPDSANRYSLFLSSSTSLSQLRSARTPTSQEDASTLVL